MKNEESKAAQSIVAECEAKNEELKVAQNVAAESEAKNENWHRSPTADSSFFILH